MSESHLKCGLKYDIASALKLVRESRAILEDAFLCKLRFQETAPRGRSPARGSADQSPSQSPPRKKQKGKGKGKYGGKKDRDNSRKKPTRPATDVDNRTLYLKKDGKPICFLFDKKGGCQRKKCSMTRVCQISLSSWHGVLDCDSR